MITPALYPEEIDNLDRYQQRDWYERVRLFHEDQCYLTYSYKYTRLWRVGVWSANGWLRRYFYGVQARIVMTLWFTLSDSGRRVKSALRDISRRDDSLATSHHPQSEGKRKRGKQGGNSRKESPTSE